MKNGENERQVRNTLNQCGIGLFGYADFESVRSGLIRCSAIKRLPPDSKTVIAAIFPYYTGLHNRANISAYAMPKDYHIIVGGLLEDACRALEKEFPENQFAWFCDASPIPEVEAARLAGLGVRGCNGLLINPEYGSFVFIGEVVADLVLEPCPNPGGRCIACGRCEQCCPGQCLHGGAFEKAKCASFLTQKKGNLSPEEQIVIKRAKSVWGCDICQNVCPMNQKAGQTQIAAFRSGLKTRLDADELTGDFARENRDRAFLWKGMEILKRNICINNGFRENNI